jgi:MoaA/NifB/PqqE/SkfB family radical SAM enzyme
MNAERLFLVLPSLVHDGSMGDMNVNQWVNILEQFAAQGGREVLLGGAEPLAYPGFWVLARRALKLSIPRVTAYLSGSLLEPQVMRSFVESGVHMLVALDSLQAEHHEVLHARGSHTRALNAIEAFLKQGLAQRVGILATATRVTMTDTPMLTAWAAGRGLARVLWTTVPDGGWPSPQLKALRLSPEEKTQLAVSMDAAARSLSGTYVGPLDLLEDPALSGGCSPLLRVVPSGDAYWGFSGDGGFIGNLRRGTLAEALHRTQAAGD